MVENAQNVVETPVNKVVIDWFKCETEFKSFCELLKHKELHVKTNIKCNRCDNE